MRYTKIGASSDPDLDGQVNQNLVIGVNQAAAIATAVIATAAIALKAAISLALLFCNYSFKMFRM